ncbi:MAG: hypothetical protein NC911_07255 [Candidatus Omnitrophica bacterium]|nr:hypothetical protein [Candidatus Omnitrophota bacterium]
MIWGRKKGKAGKITVLVVFLMLAGGVGYLAAQPAPWELQLPATIGGNPYLTLYLGMQTNATDNFDVGIDDAPPPPTPEGDTVYFSSITGQGSPYDKLAKDYRAPAYTVTTWRLRMQPAEGSQMVVSWNPGNFPAGWTFTYQESNSSWVGTGPVISMTSTTQISFLGDGTVKRYLIVATPPTFYSISGTVTLQGGGAAVTDVLLTLSGAANDTTHPAADGTYSFTGLTGGLNYTVTPTLNNYVFTPTNRSYTPLNANQTNQNFTGVFQTTLTVASARGNPTPTVGQHNYPAGTVINASVPSPVAGDAGTRYVCTGWTGTGSVPATGTTNSVQFTINVDSTITWNWKTQYQLTTQANPAAGGTVTPASGNWYDAGTVVSCNYTVNANYVFIKWQVNGDDAGNGATLDVTMDAPKTVTAVFALNQPVLQVDPTNVEFTFILQNNSKVDQTTQETTITVKNVGSGAGTLQWQVGNPVYQQGAGWISFAEGSAKTNPSGELAPQESAQFQLIVNRSGLLGGTYNATVPVTSNGGDQNITVRMNINTPPTAEVITPLSGEVEVETAIRFEANFADPDTGDTIATSSWEVYEGEIPFLKGLVPPIWSGQLTGNQNFLYLPYALFKRTMDEGKNGGQSFWWRVKCVDSRGLESDWAYSEEFSVNTAEGVPEGTLSRGEEGTLERPDMFEGKKVYVSVPVVGNDDQPGILVTIRQLNPADVPGAPSVVNTLFDIRVENLSEGQRQVVVNVDLPGNITSWWKYNPYTAEFYQYPADLVDFTAADTPPNHTRVRLTLVDGGTGDFDGNVNQTIVDPSGSGVSGGEVSGGGGCFIATAAFGSYQEHHVWILRQFRDRFLLTNPLGQAFVRWYYRHSPRYAAMIAERPAVRLVVRMLLLPVYGVAWLMLYVGWRLWLALVTIGLMTLARRRYLGLIVLLIALALVTPGWALDVNHFKPATGETTFVVTDSSSTLGAGKFEVGLVGSYASKVMEVKSGAGDQVLSDEQTVFNLSVAYGLTDKFQLSLALPLLVNQAHDAAFAWVKTSGMGNLRLAGKFGLPLMEGVGVAVVPFVDLPTGNDKNLISPDGLAGGVKVAVDRQWGEKILTAVNIGYTGQKKETLGQLEINNSFLYGAGISASVLSENTWVTLEFFGRIDGGRKGSPLEGIVSLNHQFGPVRVAFGGGAGLTDGYGTPSYRIFAGMKAGF